MGRASIHRTSKDYASLLRELTARIPQMTDRWMDFNPTDPGMVLLELFCGVADMLFYYLDAQTSEAFLPTARQRQNIINLCTLIGYRLDGPIAATTELRFSLAAALDADVSIPAHAVCRARLSDGSVIDFETTESTVIPRGVVTATAPARQGRRKRESFTVRDTLGQRIPLAGKNIAQGSVSVVVDGDPWTEVPHFVESGGDAAHFRTETDASGATVVVFGDGINGVVPATGASVVVAYLETLGGDGNVGANTIRELATAVYLAGAPVAIHVTNPMAATGGSAPETIDHARTHAPAELASLWKAVTKADFQALAEGYPGVAKAQVLDTNDCANIRYYVVNLAVAPNGGGYCSPSLKNDLAAHLAARKVITTEVNLFDPSYREIVVDAEIVTHSTEDPDLVRTRVETALQDFFAFDRMTFGQGVHQSDLVALLDGVRGVSYVHLYAPARDILPGPGEIPALGEVRLDVKRAGA
ncbi:MAG TPA: baseplate J/gp47 family protein [Phycisphaerae bacterium]|nr:baseplate J/gp47 family protein [Phycisphaerae bacterium]